MDIQEFVREYDKGELCQDEVDEIIMDYDFVRNIQLSNDWHILYFYNVGSNCNCLNDVEVTQNGKYITYQIDADTMRALRRIGDNMKDEAGVEITFDAIIE